MSFEPTYKSLGKFNPELEQLVRVTASPDPEELKCAYARIEELQEALHGVLDWIHIFSGRIDLDAVLRDVLVSQHRVIEAQELL